MKIKNIMLKILCLSMFMFGGFFIWSWKQRVFTQYGVMVGNKYQVNYKVNFNSITFYYSGNQASNLLEKIKNLNLRVIKIDKDNKNSFTICVWVNTALPNFSSGNNNYKKSCNFIVVR